MHRWVWRKTTIDASILDELQVAAILLQVSSCSKIGGSALILTLGTCKDCKDGRKILDEAITNFSMGGIAWSHQGVQAREWYREDLTGAAIGASSVPRDRLFLTSKLHPRDLAQVCIGARTKKQATAIAICNLGILRQ